MARINIPAMVLPFPLLGAIVNARDVKAAIGILPTDRLRRRARSQPGKSRGKEQQRDQHDPAHSTTAFHTSEQENQTQANCTRGPATTRTLQR
jgi:hypothetical protein